MIRHALLALAIPLALARLDAQPVQGANEPRLGGTVVIHSLSDPESLNYLTSTDAGAQEINNLMYETLTATDWETLETVPVLAESLPRLSADRLSYDVSIRRDARFADGTPVTAADFIFFLKALKNPYIVNAAPTRGYYARVDSAATIDGDPYRLRVVMAEPYYLGDQWVGGLVALPKHIWDPEGLTDRMTFAELNLSDPHRNPAVREFAEWFQDPEKARSKEYLVGSGPYGFATWRRDDRVVLARNDRYWNRDDPKWGRAYPDSIAWRTYYEDDAALEALMRGELDFMPRIEKRLFRTVRSELPRHGLDTAIYDYPAYTYVGWNTSKPIFEDPRTRAALSWAVDRARMIREIYDGYATTVQSPILPSRPEYDSTLPRIGFDLERARTMLGEAGWKDTDGDGVLDRKIRGKKRALRFTLMSNAGNERRSAMARMIAEDFRRIGVEVIDTALDWALFLNETRNGDFDAYIGGWVMGVAEGDMFQIWHSASAERGGSNYVRFRNARVDELIEQIREEFDVEKRKVRYREIQRIVHAEQPYTFLMTERLTGAISRRIEGERFYQPRPGYNPAWWSVRSGSGR